VVWKWILKFLKTLSGKSFSSGFMILQDQFYKSEFVKMRQPMNSSSAGIWGFYIESWNFLHEYQLWTTQLAEKCLLTH
jgi:hypothetical protein